MRRVIEDLVRKRQEQQGKLKNTLSQLGGLFQNTGLFLNKKTKGQISETLLRFNQDLNELITIQDKEWDAYSNNHSTGVFKSLQWKIEKLEAEYSNVKTLLINFVTLEKSLENIIGQINDKTKNIADAETAETDETDETDETNKKNSGIDDGQLKKLHSIKEQLSTYQYSDFEQRFRGDAEAVKEKLKKYVSIFSPFDHILDIGCGRGEFLELLEAEGKTAEGIDLSQSMLTEATEKGLSCRLADALEYLRLKESGQLGGIFSAQVIEHLQPNYLRDLVIEAFRALKPGAPIVLETVNPLSLFALSNIYFLDVTHQKPLHPEYMRYLLESSGFTDVGIVYSEELQEERLGEIGADSPFALDFNRNVDKLNKLLYSSPVYAVTGKKP